MRDLVGLDESEMRLIRGNDIGMVFQEPMTSLNPVYTIGDQISEPIRVHQGAGKREALRGARSACSTRSASPTPAAAPANTPTSCRAACASAPRSPWRSPATRRF